MTEPGAADPPREDDGATTEQAGTRTRIAAGGLVLFAALVAVVLIASSGSGEDDTSLAQCVTAWNSDPEAVADGSHNAVSHGYTQVRVTTLDEDGEEAEDGECAVIFAASALDPEPGFGARILRNREWRPLVGLVGTDRLRELQQEARAAPNATLSSDGTLAGAG